MPSIFSSTEANALNAIYRKIDRRVLSFLICCYCFSALDRANISFAKLQMHTSFGLTDTAFGFAAGIFFVGYALCEIPSNLILPRVGARKTISRILVLWGLTSAAMMFVHSNTTFYILRLFLGAFEAGLAPGALFLLTYWYPKARMARSVALFLCAGPIANMVGGPLSGWLLTRWDGVLGLEGWQWMFVVEGLPCVLLGIIAWLTMTDRPATATWLTETEKALLARDLDTPASHHKSFFHVIADWQINRLALAYFCIVCGMYTISFWLPTILKAVPGISLMSIGMYSSIPYVISLIVMTALGRRSDRKMERRWHSAIPAFLAAIALGIAALSIGKLGLSLISITIAEALMYASYAVFWSMPSEYIKGASASGGIAYVNTVGLIGGLVSPNIIGMLKASTGSLLSGLFVMCGLLVVASLLLALGRPLLAAAPKIALEP